MMVGCEKVGKRWRCNHSLVPAIVDNMVEKQAVIDGLGFKVQAFYTEVYWKKCYYLPSPFARLQLFWTSVDPREWGKNGCGSK